MDPNNLDPKLKATYDKVMGTPTAPVQPAQPVQPVTPVTTMPMPPAPIAPATGPVIPTDSPQAAMPTNAAYTPDNLSFQAAIQAPAATGMPIGTQVQQPAHSTSAALKVLYIVAAIVFFVVYTFVWMKIFNIPLPF